MTEEQRLYREIEAIKESIVRVEERKQSLNQDIAAQTTVVGNCRIALEQVQGEKEQKIVAIQQKMQELSGIIGSEQPDVPIRELNLV